MRFTHALTRTKLVITIRNPLQLIKTLPGPKKQKKTQIVSTQLHNPVWFPRKFRNAKNTETRTRKE